MLLILPLCFPRRDGYAKPHFYVAKAFSKATLYNPLDESNGNAKESSRNTFGFNRIRSEQFLNHDCDLNNKTVWLPGIPVPRFR